MQKLDMFGKPKTKSVKVLVATMAVMAMVVENRDVTEDEIAAKIREFTGDDEDLFGAVCFLFYSEIKRIASKQA
jgi:cobalamin biosynthesis protein CbiD